MHALISIPEGDQTPGFRIGTLLGKKQGSLSV